MDQKLSRHASPSKNHQSSPSRRRKSKSTERDVPIKMISIEVMADEDRDDEATNILVTLIQKRDWNGVLIRLKENEGINEAGRILPTKDYPLHLLCKCGQDYKASPHRSSRSSYTTESGSSADLTSRANSSLSGSGTLTSTHSLHKNNASTELEEESFPSKEVLVSAMNAFPEAVTIPGEDNATPLHWAVRHRYPLKLLNVLIRTFPQALDLKDSSTRTPRNYAKLTDDPCYRGALLRPTACWVQHLQDEQLHQQMTKDIVAMEGQMHFLCQVLDESLQEEEAINQQVMALEAELESFGDAEHLRGLSDSAAELHQELERCLEVIRGTLEGLVGQTILKNKDEEKERSLLAAFNMDVERIYNNVNEGLDDWKTDIDRITGKVESPTRSKR